MASGLEREPHRAPRHSVQRLVRLRQAPPGAPEAGGAAR